MATTITAGNATNGLAFSADNTGILELKTGTGAGTTAITIGVGQAVALAGQASVAGTLSFNSGYGSAAVAYGCRAWVNFNGTGTVAIRASGNVSSITDNGTGNYTVNFTTAMPDANYSAVPAGSFADGTSDKNQGVVIARNLTPLTTTSCRLMSGDGGGTQVDLAIVTLAIFR
jgi:uncharacterized protein (AIM24 family)